MRSSFSLNKLSFRAKQKNDKKKQLESVESTLLASQLCDNHTDSLLQCRNISAQLLYRLGTICDWQSPLYTLEISMTCISTSISAVPNLEVLELLALEGFMATGGLCNHSGQRATCVASVRFQKGQGQIRQFTHIQATSASDVFEVME